MIRVYVTRFSHLQDPCKFLQIAPRPLGMTGPCLLDSVTRAIYGPAEHCAGL